MHARQSRTCTHVLSEISLLLKEQENLEEKLARVRETSLEQRNRIKAEEDKCEREKQELSHAAEMKLAQVKAEEAERVRELEEATAQIKAAAEEEAQRRQQEEDELVREKQKLETALANVKLVLPFGSVLSTPCSNVTGFILPMSPPPTRPNVGEVAECLFQSPRRKEAVDKSMPGASAVISPAASPKNVATIEDWLGSIQLQQYAAAIKDYGYDSLEALYEALEGEIEEMVNDPSINMKKPHRGLLMRKWKTHPIQKQATDRSGAAIGSPSYVFAHASRSSPKENPEGSVDLLCFGNAQAGLSPAPLLLSFDRSLKCVFVLSARAHE